MPSIVLIPGAWLTPTFYTPFLHALNNSGFTTHYIEYPSLDPANPATADCHSDTIAITNAIAPILDNGEDIVLLMHSYAGMPGAAAAAELAKRGSKGRIVGLVFIAAFVVPEGVSCAGLQGGELPGWILGDRPSSGVNVPADPIQNFAADIDSTLLHESNFSAQIRPHSNLAFQSPQPRPAWAGDVFKDKLTFIITTNDPAVPKEAQYAMINATGKEWKIKEMDCSHCAPFISKIDETVSLVGEFLSS